MPQDNLSKSLLVSRCKQTCASLCLFWDIGCTEALYFLRIFIQSDSRQSNICKL